MRSSAKDTTAFERLPPGRTTRTREETAQHQRARLLAAMVESVREKGYPATTLRDVVGLAGVSNRSFYEHFDSMQDCFMAAFDEVVSRIGTEVLVAYLAETDFPKQLKAVFDVYQRTVLEKPKEVHLALIDLISLGADGVARRLEVAGTLETLISDSVAKEPPGKQLSELVVRGIIGGLQLVAYRRVQSGKADRLPAEFDALVAWALSYRQPIGRGKVYPPTARPVRPDPTIAERDLGEEWICSRPATALSQRERIVRAATIVAGERGYASLSIPAITREARVSNETFYRHFQGTEQAFLAAIDTLGIQLIKRIEKAYAGHRCYALAIAAGLEALLTFLEENPGLGRLLLIDALAAGHPTLQRVDLFIDNLIEIFELRTTRGANGEPLPPVVVEAIGGGPFFIVQREVLEGRSAHLIDILPDLVFFVTAPCAAPAR